jgi:molybdate transport system substrate-binding protein
LLGAGCGEDPPDTLLVSAAASLTDVFAVFEEDFEATHPGVDVILNLGATSTLTRQLVEGAPADVFASADLAHMDVVEEAGLVGGEPSVFATNRLEIAVGEGNPTAVTGLADLAEEDRAVGLCAPTVPCGRLAREALATAGISPALDSEEPNVRALLTKIAVGDLDVGIVYRSDVVADPRVEGIAIPEEVNPVNQYAVAALARSEHPELAEEFVEYVLSPRGRDVLESAGFGLP